jgi:hypothetical protein
LQILPLLQQLYNCRPWGSFMSDFDARVSQIAELGLEPPERETYANGIRKARFRDPDGNEIGFAARRLTETEGAARAEGFGCRFAVAPFDARV